MDAHWTESRQLKKGFTRISICSFRVFLWISGISGNSYWAIPTERTFYKYPLDTIFYVRSYVAFFHCRWECFIFFVSFFLSCFPSRPNDAVHFIGNQTEKPFDPPLCNSHCHQLMVAGNKYDRRVTEKKQTGRIYTFGVNIIVKTRKGPFRTLLYFSFSVSLARVSSLPHLRLNTRRAYIRRIWAFPQPCIYEPLPRKIIKKNIFL